MLPGDRLPRDQVPAFGSEIRDLLETSPEAAGIVVSELNVLAERKFHGQGHPEEDSLSGLAGVSYLRIYRKGHSIRAYFTVIDGRIWMLHLEPSKRKTKLAGADIKKLKQRLEQATKRAKGGQSP